MVWSIQYSMSSLNAVTCFLKHVCRFYSYSFSESQYAIIKTTRSYLMCLSRNNVHTANVWNKVSIASSSALSLSLRLTAMKERAGLGLRWKGMSVSICNEAAHLLQIPHNQIANEIPDWISRGMLEYSISLRVTAAWLQPWYWAMAGHGCSTMRWLSVTR